MLVNRWKKKQGKVKLQNNSDLFLSYVTQYLGNKLYKVGLNL